MGHASCVTRERRSSVRAPVTNLSAAKLPVRRSQIARVVCHRFRQRACLQCRSPD